MPVPNYDSNTNYEVGQLVTFNDVVYAKQSSGEDTSPGTDGSFWAINSQDQESLNQLVQDLEQQLTDAGFKVSYVRAILAS